MLYGLFGKPMLGYYKGLNPNEVLKLWAVEPGLFCTTYYYNIIKQGNIIFKSTSISSTYGKLFKKKNIYTVKPITDKMDLIGTLVEDPLTNKVYSVECFIRTNSNKRFNSVLLKNVLTRDLVRIKITNLYNNYRKMN